MPDTTDGTAMAANVMEFGRVPRRIGLDVDPATVASLEEMAERLARL